VRESFWERGQRNPVSLPSTHLNIAKVLDAGATVAGRPYFVMELVKGISITKFCDQEHLTPRDCLELFVLVCQAVQHAHQKDGQRGQRAVGASAEFQPIEVVAALVRVQEMFLIEIHDPVIMSPEKLPLEQRFIP
jgi:serine/threonine protein kinase